MDLIEVLWKQDVDLGFSLEIPTVKSPKQEVAEETSQSGPTTSLGVPNDDIEKLKALKAVNEENIKVSNLYWYLELKQNTFAIHRSSYCKLQI